MRNQYHYQQQPDDDIDGLVETLGLELALVYLIDGVERVDLQNHEEFGVVETIGLRD